MGRSRSLIAAVWVAICCLAAGGNAAPTEGGAANVRYCVPEKVRVLCEELVALSPSSGIKCVVGRDRVDCARMLEVGEADALAAEPEDMYVATRLVTSKGKLNIPVQLRTIIDQESPWRYQAVAVVRADFKPGLSALKGLRSCHTGIGRNVGYKIPVTKLTKMGILHVDEAAHSPREAELRALSELFGSACIVGKWSADPVQDARLKTQYASLCSLCEHPVQCDYPDAHSGYDGALRCLQHGGDIAWTKPVFVRKHFQEPGSEPSKYAYLCPDGTTKPLGDLSSLSAPCAWASRPWPGVLSAVAGHQQALRDALKALYMVTKDANRPELAKAVLTLGDNVTLVNVDPIEPGQYLEQAGYKDVIERGASETHQPARICVTTQTELDKCQMLYEATFARDLRPVLKCVKKDSLKGCSEGLTNQEVDLWIADGADAVLVETHNTNVHVLALETLQSGDADKVVAITSGKSSWTTIEEASKAGARLCIDKSDNAIRAAAQSLDLLQNGCEASESSDAIACLTNKPSAAFALIRQRQLDALPAPKKSEFVILCSKASADEACPAILKIPPKTVLGSSESSAKERTDAAVHVIHGAAKLFAGRPEVFRLFGTWDGHRDVIVSDVATGLTSFNLDSDLPERKALHQIFAKLKCPIN